MKRAGSICRTKILSFEKTNTRRSHEVFEDIHMNAVADVEECTVLDAAGVSVTEDFGIDVKIEVEMGGCGLHAPDAPVGVERRAAALASEAGRREFKSNRTGGVIDQTRDHAFDRELGRHVARIGVPSDL